MFNINRTEENLNIIHFLKQGQATPEQLKNYSGWGGLRKAIYTPHIYQKLKKSLTDAEIISIKKTLSNAYYTPPELVQFIYAFLGLYRFKGGSILEPSIGNGVFIEHMPDPMRAKSQITAVELDNLTSQIAQQRYPFMEVNNMAFENYQPTQKFDLIIGNPPYGKEKVKDAYHADLNKYRIHHYFIAKSMRLLKEGGLLAMVLPSFFMDNETQQVRDVIHQEGGDLIAAYRLPDDLFSDAKVTIDIVFLKKGYTGKKWLRAPKIKIGQHSDHLNEYYHTHPHHILGNLEIVDMYNRKGLTCKRLGDPFELLNQALKQVKQAKEAFIARKLADIEKQMTALTAQKRRLFKTI